MTQRTVDSWLKQWTCVGGTCAPPPFAPKNGWERTLDQYVSLTAPVLRGCWAIPVGLGVFFLSRAIGAGGLYLAGLYFCAYSAYCLANFARCGEAHCIVTGLGWGILGVVALVAAVMQLHWLGPIWNTFVIVFVVGHGFEIIWSAVRHTHSLRA
jgi:hypothetical protein